MLFEKSILVVCYLIGSIPFSLLLSKFFNLPDPRKEGSGNIGVSNVLRTSGNYWFTLSVAFLDISKGITAAWLGEYIDNMALCTAFVLLGNLFSIFPGSSGKGISVLLGVLIFLHPYALVLLPIWFILAKKTYPVIGSLLIIMIALAYVLFGDLHWSMLILCLIILAKHMKNFRRLVSNQEKKI